MSMPALTHFIPYPTPITMFLVLRQPTFHRLLTGMLSVSCFLDSLPLLDRPAAWPSFEIRIGVLGGLSHYPCSELVVRICPFCLQHPSFQICEVGGLACRTFSDALPVCEAEIRVKVRASLAFPDVFGVLCAEGMFIVCTRNWEEHIADSVQIICSFIGY